MRAVRLISSLLLIMSAQCSAHGELQLDAETGELSMIATFLTQIATLT